MYSKRPPHLQHVHCDEVTSEEEEEEEMGEVTIPDSEVEYLLLNGPIPLHPVLLWICWQQDIDLDQDLDHYDMKEEEPVDGKKSEDDGIEKENLAILEKIRKNQRQDHLNVRARSLWPLHTIQVFSTSFVEVLSEQK